MVANFYETKYHPFYPAELPLMKLLVEHRSQCVGNISARSKNCKTMIFTVFISFFIIVMALYIILLRAVPTMLVSTPQFIERHDGQQGRDKFIKDKIILT